MEQVFKKVFQNTELNLNGQIKKNQLLSNKVVFI